VRAVAPPWPGAFGEVEGRLASIYRGRPAGAAELADLADRPAPGSVRRAGGRIWIAAGDGWFEVEEAAGLAGAPPPTDPFAAVHSSRDVES
jgi:methionyl-tRNA formyltransferase